MGKMLKIMLAQDTDTQTGCAAALRANGFEVETVRKDVRINVSKTGNYTMAN